MHTLIARVTRAAVVSAAALAAMPALAAPPAAAQGPPEVEFQFNYRPAAWDALAENIGGISLLVPEWFIVDGTGTLTGDVEPRVLELARDHGVPVMVQVKNFDRARGAFSAEWAHDLLTDDAARARAIDRFLELSREHGFHGVQLELEGVHIGDRDALTRFVREAAAALRDAGFRFSVSAIHREEEGPGPDSYTAWMWEHWRGVYDLEALGEAADFVRAVVYAQHTRRTPPGPSQSLPWLERVMDHFVDAVPPEKLVLGVGMGAAHWFTVADPERYHIGARSWNRGISRAELRALLDHSGASPGTPGPATSRVAAAPPAPAAPAAPAAPMVWDDRQKAAFGFIERAGVFEWLVSDNDVRAFDAKLDLARRLGLRGVSMWVTGDEEPGMWSRFRPRRLELAPGAAAVVAAGATGAPAAGRTEPAAPPAAFGGVPVLAWHYLVDDEPAVDGPLTDTFARFEALVAFLAEEGFRSVFPEEARAPGPGGGRPVILTFDDGRKEHLRAAEILERHGFRGIFFVIPSRTDGGSDLYLDGEEVARLAEAGHRVAVHGYEHLSLPLAGAEVGGSVALAHDRLRAATGAAPSALEFAFPYGHYTPEVNDALAARYRYLMTVNPGYWDPGDTMVPRMLILSNMDPAFYRTFLLGAAEHAPALRPLDRDGASLDAVRFAVQDPDLPDDLEILTVSPDAAGRNYAIHPAGPALIRQPGAAGEPDTLVLDLRRHRDRHYPPERDALGYAVVRRTNDGIRFLSPGLLHWLADPAGGPRLEP